MYEHLWVNQLGSKVEHVDQTNLIYSEPDYRVCMLEDGTFEVWQLLAPGEQYSRSANERLNKIAKVIKTNQKRERPAKLVTSTGLEYTSIRSFALEHKVDYVGLNAVYKRLSAFVIDEITVIVRKEE